MDAAALWLTLQLATWTTLILFVLGMPLAWWLASTRWSGRWIVESVVSLPLVLPPTVLGFYILMVTGPNSFLGKGIETTTGGRLPFTFQGILVASLLYNLPFTIRPFTAAMMAVDQSLIEASWCLGESRLATFVRVVLPLSWPGILTGLVLTFAHCVGEFGIVLMVGGNIPGVTRTLSISIYDDVQALDYAAAGETACWLVLFSFLALCFVYRSGRRGGIL
jgi:molybdate transport system permease protein